MTSKEIVDRILLDPARAFAAPADVLGDARFTTDQKIEILRRWEYDAVELGVATEEGMSNHTADLLPQIVEALTELGAEINTDRTPPTKQGGFDKGSIKRRT